MEGKLARHPVPSMFLVISMMLVIFGALVGVYVSGCLFQGLVGVAVGVLSSGTELDGTELEGTELNAQNHCAWLIPCRHAKCPSCVLCCFAGMLMWCPAVPKA
jgi:hypothetical protein